MCDYCDCRRIGPVAELSEEHQVMSALAARLRQHLAMADEAAAAAVLRQLQALLGPHLAKEEAGIFAQFAAKEDSEWYLGELRADHARARSALIGAKADEPTWAAVLTALDELAKHIEVEEYDLFPASRVFIDDQGWAQVMSAHEHFGPCFAAAAPVVSAVP
jgi:hemerythrin-like domain-containing protein